MIICPSCSEVNIVKNGKTHYGKQNHLCKECGWQFVINNTHTIGKEVRRQVKRALNERCSLRGICRIFKVSLTWLMSFAVEVWEGVPEHMGLTENLMGKLHPEKAQLIVLQLDEAWSL